MEKIIDQDHKTKSSSQKSPKKLICIICNEKLTINNDKHNCSYRTSNTICINYNNRLKK